MVQTRKRWLRLWYNEFPEMSELINTKSDIVKTGAF